MKNGMGLWLGLAALSSAALAQPAGPPVRVGIYDSRAIAVAYARSDMMRQWMAGLRAERDKAKAAGDENKVRELEARGGEQQKRFHEQGFGTASVANLMDRIRDRIPAVAQEAGVVLIVSKWEVMYKDPAIEYVDVTLPLVRNFTTDAQALQTVEELMKQPPVPLEALADEEARH